MGGVNIQALMGGGVIPAGGRPVSMALNLNKVSEDGGEEGDDDEDGGRGRGSLTQQSRPSFTGTGGARPSLTGRPSASASSGQSSIEADRLAALGGSGDGEGGESNLSHVALDRPTQDRKKRGVSKRAAFKADDE